MERLFSFAGKQGAAPIDDDADAAEQIRSNRAMIYRTIERGFSIMAADYVEI